MKNSSNGKYFYEPIRDSMYSNGYVVGALLREIRLALMLFTVVKSLTICDLFLENPPKWGQLKNRSVVLKY